mgnify:CR=1 FL=1
MNGGTTSSFSNAAEIATIVLENGTLGTIKVDGANSKLDLNAAGTLNIVVDDNQAAITLNGNDCDDVEH